MSTDHKKLDRFKNEIKSSYVYTVKLGYNELGYNEHPVITNELNTIGWFKSF